ncbi:MAG: hypothetical protein D3924_15680 [Candidatus Electrothrix sp. AR4]|nr:hypothetical protein [Candidatus Electrothrix sp. AR4]
MDQFFWIEYEEFSAQIAQVAMWLVDYQMNLKVSEVFGVYFARLPLTATQRVANRFFAKLDFLRNHQY